MNKVEIIKVLIKLAREQDAYLSLEQARQLTDEFERRCEFSKIERRVQS